MSIMEKTWVLAFCDLKLLLRSAWGIALLVAPPAIGILFDFATNLGTTLHAARLGAVVLLTPILLSTWAGIGCRRSNPLVAHLAGLFVNRASLAVLVLIAVIFQTMLYLAATAVLGSGSTISPATMASIPLGCTIIGTGAGIVAGTR